MTNLNSKEWYEVTDAEESDLPDLKALLAKTVPDCAPQTVWELPMHWATYRVVRDDAGKVIAAAALQRLPGNRAEVRGLVVDLDWRGRGLANVLIEDLLAQAKRDRTHVVCVTKNPSFFARHGFMFTFPTWLTRGRHMPRASAEDDPRVCMISCDSGTAQVTA